MLPNPPVLPLALHPRFRLFDPSIPHPVACQPHVYSSVDGVSISRIDRIRQALQRVSVHLVDLERVRTESDVIIANLLRTWLPNRTYTSYLEIEVVLVQTRPTVEYGLPK